MIGDEFPNVPSLSLQEDSHRFVHNTSMPPKPRNLIQLKVLLSACIFISQTWMWVIGPMILYLCERIVRFIRYMQRVRYRRVRSTHHPFLSSEMLFMFRRSD